MDSLDAIPAEPDPNRVVSAGHPDVENFPSKAHVATRQIARRAPILQFNQGSHHVLRIALLANGEMEVSRLENLRGVESIDD